MKFRNLKSGNHKSRNGNIRFKNGKQGAVNVFLQKLKRT